MGKKILDSKILYVVLSILLAFAAWLFVTSKDGTKDSAPFTNLPVEFVGEDILEEQGLMIVSRDVRASITVQAQPMVLAVLKSDQPKLVATVSSIKSEGTHGVNYKVQLPTGVRESDVEIIYGGRGGLSGSVVNVEVARFLRREGVEIRGEFQGSVADGYLAGDRDDFLFNPATLTISGQAEMVNQVAYAKVIVTGQDLTDTVSDQFQFKLFGANDNPLEELDVTCDVDVIYTVFPIRATAEIPLKVNVIPGGGLSENDVRLELSGNTITVAGSKEAVDALAGEGELILGTVNLAELDDNLAQNGGPLTFPIPLADELENLSGITEVVATLSVHKRVETRIFQATSHISTINAPEGWTPTIITQVLAVRVRGPAELLDELTEENLRVVADLKDINEAAGPHAVSATIYLYSAGTVSDVGVVTPRDYSIVVSLAQDG